MKRSRIHLIVTALLLIVVGVVCIVNPGAGFATMAWLVGLLLMVSGVITLLFSVKSRGVLPNATMSSFLGVFELVIGVLFLVNIMFAATTLIIVFALWVLFEGISLTVLSFDYKRVGYNSWWIMSILGVVSIILAFLALRYPESTSSLLGILLGLGVFSNGVVRLVAYFALRKIGDTVRDVKESLTAHNIDDIQD